MTEQQANESEETTSTRTRRPSSETKRKTSSESKQQQSSSSKEQTTTQKRPQRKSAERPASSERSSSERSSAEAKQRQPAKPKLSARKAAAAALEQLQQLTTRTPESVIGVEPHDDGWRVTIEVVESARIPNTADIMAEYEVDIDSSSELVGYNRGARYSRGRTQIE